VLVDSRLDRSLVTDVKRLQQVLKNLLSNAFKFTSQGGVRLNVSAATGGWDVVAPGLNLGSGVVAFEVADTGIGIPPEKQPHRVRGVPAGRCEHEPQVRRHGSGAGDQSRAGRSAWW
jgi:signal transduction histidine kinase